MSRNSSNSGGDGESLRLKVLRDLEDDGVTCLQESYCRHISKIGMAENYLMNNIQIEIGLRFRPEGQNFKLIIRAYTIGAEEPTQSVAGIKGKIKVRDTNTLGRGRYNQARSMLVRTGDPTEQPKNVIPAAIEIPSRVWLKGPKDRMQLTREVFAGTLCHGNIKVIGIFCEGKVCIPPAPSHHMKSSGMGGLIQSIPEVLDNVGCQTPCAVRYRNKFHDDFCIPGLRIFLFDHSCRVFVEKSSRDYFQLVEFLTAPCD